MAGTNLYLIRNNNLTWAKYANVVDVFLSTKETPYTSVSGNSTTNVVTIAGASLVNGMIVTFTSLTGGSGVTVNTPYYVINASAATCKLAKTPGGSAVALGTNITAGAVIVSTDAMRAWSSEFRDIFSGLGAQGAAFAGSIGGVNYLAGFGAPQGFGIYADPNEPITAALSGSSTFTMGYLEGTPKATVSDEVSHFPLRQTLLNKTFWLFDMGASAQPRYLPAEYQEGDIISTSPPQIP
jgi:hypothetical protein